MKNKILVSKCLLGKKVRWNGAQKFDSSLLDWLTSNDFEIVPICPEHDLFGTPRAPIKLIYTDRIRAIQSSMDISSLLESRCKEIVDANPDVVGFIGVYGSPSCGVSVGVKNLGSVIKGYMHKFGSFPTTESSQLRSEKNRDIFLKRIEKFRSKTCLL